MYGVMKRNVSRSHHETKKSAPNGAAAEHAAGEPRRFPRGHKRSRRVTPSVFALKRRGSREKLLPRRCRKLGRLTRSAEMLTHRIQGCLRFLGRS
jgi:hypothetical protein